VLVTTKNDEGNDIFVREAERLLNRKGEDITDNQRLAVKIGTRSLWCWSPPRTRRATTSLSGRQRGFSTEKVRNPR
jgi:hypothetical protein